MPWALEHHIGRAADHLALAPAGVRTLRRFDLLGPAVILGSSQAEAGIDEDRARAAGVEVVRRPSGGGAVLVAPDDVVWIDIYLPAGDRLWHDDVGVAFHWLGRAWVDALVKVGVSARWHDGPMRHTPWSKVVCFAGLGPGEVVDPGGRKVVGLSQRRTRTHVRFQCAALLRWDPAALVALLAGPHPEGAAAGDLAEVAAGIGPERAEPLLDAFHEVLDAL